MQNEVLLKKSTGTNILYNTSSWWKYGASSHAVDLLPVFKYPIQMIYKLK